MTKTKYFHDAKSDFRDWNNSSHCYSLPSQSLLQKWLRDKKGVDFWFGQLNSPNKYHVEDIVRFGESIGCVNEGSRTYEKALEAGLTEALKLIP